MTATLAERPHAETQPQQLPRHDAAKRVRYTAGLTLAARLLCWATRNSGSKS